MSTASRTPKNIIDVSHRQRRSHDPTHGAANHDKRSLDQNHTPPSRPSGSNSGGSAPGDVVDSHGFGTFAADNEEVRDRHEKRAEPISVSPNISIESIARVPTPSPFPSLLNDNTHRRSIARESRPASIASVISSNIAPAVDRAGERFRRLRRDLHKDLWEIILTSNLNVPDKKKLRDQHAYILDRDFSKVMTPNRLHDFFDLLPSDRQDPRIDPNNRIRFRKVIAILVLIEWEPWRSFTRLFYSGVGTRRGREFCRSDKHLPFIDLGFLRRTDTANSFDDAQKLFNPAILDEFEEGQELQKIKRTTRLPLSSKEPCNLRERTNRQIYKIEVDADSINFRTAVGGSSMSGKSKQVYAMKQFSNADDFGREYEIQKSLLIRSATAKRLEHIVYGISFFRREYEVDSKFWTYHAIIYPWAELDLDNLFFGQFAGFSGDTKNCFTPNAILSQLDGLLEALSDLHTVFNTLHSDIKPANVLIYGMSSSPCGTWKLADFGLAALREPSLKVTDGQRPIEDRTSLPAPREAGPYQPPEMRLNGTVNRKSDVYSIGAIFYVALAFMTGGPENVKKFCELRQGAKLSSPEDRDLFFYKCGDTPTTYRLKDELEQWDTDLIELHTREDTHTHLRELQILITSMINPLRDERPSTEDALKSFHDLVHAWPDDVAQMWSYEQESENLIVQRQSPSTLTSKHEDDPAYVPWHATRLDQPLPIRLKYESKDLRVTIGQEWFVGWSRKEARVYDLALAAKKIDHKLRPHRPPGDSEFESFHLSGNFMGCILNDPGGSKKFELVDLSQDSALSLSVPDGCQSVVLSAKGGIAFVYKDKVVLTLPLHERGTTYTVQQPIINELVKAVSFSHDGEYLCICTVDSSPGDEKVLWRVYHYEQEVAETLGETTEDGFFTGMHWRFWHVPREISVTGSILSIKLVPSLVGQKFFAFDQEDRYWIIDCEDTRLSNSLIVRSHGCGSPEDVCPLSSNSVLLTSRPTNDHTVALSAIAQYQPGGRSKQYQSLVFPSFQSCVHTDGSAINTVGAVKLGDSTYIAVHKGEYLELKRILFDQQESSDDDDHRSDSTIQASRLSLTSELSQISTTGSN